MTRRRADGVPVRIYQPLARPSAAGALLWIHGGGYVLGHPRQDDYLCKSVAAEHGCVVVSPDYRLAPQHPFPAAHDDCAAVWTWLTRPGSDLGVDPGCIALGGQSAGAGLAMGLALRIRDEHWIRPRALWLFAPMVDDATAATPGSDHGSFPVWTPELNRAAWAAYLGTDPGSDGVSAYAAPARATDLGDIPPTWIGVGDVDLFDEEDLTLATRLRSHGTRVELVVVPDGFHGFETLARRTVTARDFRQRAGVWLAAQFGQPS